MSKLSITSAWDETAAFVKHEAGPLFLIAFGLMTLPSIIFQVLAQKLAPGFGQPGMAGQMAGTTAGLVMLLVIPVVLLSIWGSLTIAVLALRREAVIGGAFALAARRLLPLVGAYLLISLGAAILSIPLVIAVGVAAKGSQLAGTGLLVLLAFFVAIGFIGVRLMLMTPVAAAEPLGPIALIRRSWELTSGHFWKLFLFLFLAVSVLLALMIALGATAGILIALLLGRPEPGSLASVLTLLVSGLVQAGIGMLMAVMIARIYDQLSGGVASTAEVFK